MLHFQVVTESEDGPKPIKVRAIVQNGDLNLEAQDEDGDWDLLLWLGGDDGKVHTACGVDSPFGFSLKKDGSIAVSRT